MRIAIAQLNLIIGDFEKNVARIQESIERGKKAGAHLVVFPELSVCGYPPLDFLEFDDFIKRSLEAVNSIAKSCTGIAAIVGGPSRNPVSEGKNLFNSAFVLEHGKVSAVVRKGLLPTYDVFDEYRYFEPGRNAGCVEIGGIKIALTICEDLWNEGEDPLYTHYPMDVLEKEKPALMINIAASPFDYDHAAERKRVLQKNVQKYGLPLLYVNHVGAQTELIFDGGSVAMQADGSLAKELNYFEEDFACLDFNGKWQGAASVQPDSSKASRMHDGLVIGVRDYFSKLGLKKAILGLSGGIDSALVAVLAVRALGKENVKV